jgi:hypothetical protein
LAIDAAPKEGKFYLHEAIEKFVTEFALSNANEIADS